MDAVRTHQLASVVAVDQVVVILLLFPVHIRFLDGTAGRRIVAGDGQTNHGAIGHGDGLLHQSFAECPAADDDAPVPILYGPRKDFACRSRGFVYQYDQTSLFKVSASGRFRFFARLLVSFGVDNQFVFVQELVRQVDGDVEVAAPVPLQVENQMLHSLFSQLLQCLFELVGRRGGEAVELDVAGCLVCHVGGVKAVHRDLPACDFEFNQVGHALAQDFHADFRVFGSSQPFHHVGVFHLDTRNQCVVYHDDAVARHQPDFLRRPAGNDLYHIQRVG